MIRPALMSLLAFALAVPAAVSAADPAGGRCSPKLKALLDKPGDPIPLVVGPWERDLAADNDLCDDAVWRIAGTDSVKARYASTGLRPATLDQIAAALGKVDTDALALEAAATNVYNAAKSANLIKGVTETPVKIKSASIVATSLQVNQSPTQFDSSDRDKAASLLTSRAAALALIAAPGDLPKDAKPGTPTPSSPGPLIRAYYQSLDRVRADVMAASALGLKVPVVAPLIPPSTTLLSDNYHKSAEALAQAKGWDDQAANGSAMDLLQDRALRNRVALHTANVEAIYQEARNIAGSARTGQKFITDQKQKDLDAINKKLREKVNQAIAYDTAKQAFDGDVAHDSAYADSEEGRYRATELKQSKAMADSAEVAANGKGGYQLQYKDANGVVHVVAGKENIPDLKTAQGSLDDLTSSLAAKIQDDHKLLAKTQAAVSAAMAGSTAFGDLGSPMANSVGCDKKGEGLKDYQNRLRDQQMEGSADASAKRQGPLKVYREKLQQIDDQYRQNLTLMSKANADKIKERDTKTAHDEYVAATQGAGTMDDDIAARTARITTLNKTAEDAFVENIQRNAWELKTKMRANLSKYADKAQSRVLLTDGGADDGQGTLFDQFIAEEWTYGKGDIQANAQRCKSEYRQGEYGSLEACAGKTLKTWLAKRKGGGPAPAADIDAQIRAGDNNR